MPRPHNAACAHDANAQFVIVRAAHGMI
jgi:hypothetical protein